MLRLGLLRRADDADLLAVDAELDAAQSDRGLCLQNTDTSGDDPAPDPQVAVIVRREEILPLQSHGRHAAAVVLGAKGAGYAIPAALGDGHATHAPLVARFHVDGVARQAAREVAGVPRDRQPEHRALEGLVVAGNEDAVSARHQDGGPHSEDERRFHDGIWTAKTHGASLQRRRPFALHQLHLSRVRARSPDVPVPQHDEAVLLDRGEQPVAVRRLLAGDAGHLPARVLPLPGPDCLGRELPGSLLPVGQAHLPANDPPVVAAAHEEGRVVLGEAPAEAEDDALVARQLPNLDKRSVGALQPPQSDAPVPAATGEDANIFVERQGTHGGAAMRVLHALRRLHTTKGWAAQLADPHVPEPEAVPVGATPKSDHPEHLSRAQRASGGLPAARHPHALQHLLGNSVIHGAPAVKMQASAPWSFTLPKLSKGRRAEALA
eukprot:scaffold596_cov236-Pinguiococcus_pyrenoidosus.AAC.5